VDLHKFLPANKWYERFCASRRDFDGFLGQSTYCAIKVQAQELEQALESVNLASEPDYVRKLVPQLLEFCKAHLGHRMFAISDLGDLPWGFPTEGWWEWKEKPAAFDFHTYLPRNLIEDLGIRDWPSAVSALKDHPSGYNPSLEATSGDAMQFKLGFERAVAKQKAEHVNGL
jgi:hypothetical protein